MTSEKLDLSSVTGEELAADLKPRLTLAFQALDKAIEANLELTSLGVGLSAPEVATVGSLVISAFLKDWESKLTRHYSEGTHARVDLRSDFQMTTRGVRDVLANAGVNEQDNSQCCEAIFKAFPFEDCAKQARLEAATLEDRGLQDCADQLAKELQLIRYHESWCNSPVKIKGSRMVCQYRFDSFFFGDKYAWQDPKAMSDYASEFRVLEQEMGDIGIAAAFETCKQGLEGSRHASRTKVVEGGPVEFVAFKNHLDMRFSPEATDMILAFLKLHSSKNIIDLSEA